MEENASSDETLLVERAARGDADAFDALVEATREFVYRTALRVVRDTETACDVAQDVFLRVYRSLGGLEDRARFRPWLHRIAVRTAINHLHKRKPQEELVPMTGEGRDPPAAPAGNPATAAENRELGEAIRAAIEDLPEDQRVAVVLCDLEGLSYEEIAEACGIPKGTVMSRIHYGRKKLRQRLAGLLEVGAP